MAINIKFSKFDNRPWGFRLAGGSDFPQPLTVIRVTEGSLAECMGLRVGDVIVRLNDQPISTLSHGQAHEALSLAGNNFVLGVHRVEDTETLVEALKKDNIEPYAISLEDLPPLQPLEEILTQLTAEPPIEEEQQEEIVEQDFEEKIEIIEEVPEKPKDADSEEVPNQNLTDEEIAQLILEEEELLPDKGVLGVNFKKLRPRAPLFKESKVFEELQKEATAEPPQVQELKRTTTFLQKPERPIPKPKSAKGEESSAESQETYKVVIRKQTKKSITERLLEKGLLEPGCVKTPEPGSEVKMYVPSWVAEAETQQVALEPTNVTESDDPTDIVEPTFVDSAESIDSLESDDSTSFVETTETANFPESTEQTTALELVKSTDFVESTENSSKSDKSSVLTMDRSGLKTRKPKKLYMRNRYFENCVLRKKHSGEKKKGVPSVRLYRKGHYLNKIVGSFTEKRSDRKTEVPVQPIRNVGRSFKIRIRGHYVQKYLERKGGWVVETAKCSVQNLLSSPKTSSSKTLSSKTSSSRTLRRKSCYAQRIFSQYVTSSQGLLNSFSSPSVLDRSEPVSNSNSNFVSSVKDSLSNEIFHRGCKRLWSKYRTETGWFDWVKNLSGISLKVSKKVPVDGEMVCKEKALDVDNLNDNRRLSFVPTVLYDGLTNRIGVDFTRVVVYAFVPCASVVLLYAYK